MTNFSFFSAGWRWRRITLEDEIGFPFRLANRNPDLRSPTNAFKRLAIAGCKIYVDGGLLDNLPTDVAKEMGADAIIAVHLEKASISPDASLSSIATLAQSFSVVTAVNERRGMELADVLVQVDVTKISGTDYNNADKLIAQGYEAAQKSAAALLKFAVDDSAWQAYLGRREARRIKSVPVPSFVEVNGTTPQWAERMERDLQDNERRAINEAQLEQAA